MFCLVRTFCREIRALYNVIARNCVIECINEVSTPSACFPPAKKSPSVATPPSLRHTRVVNVDTKRVTSLAHAQKHVENTKSHYSRWRNVSPSPHQKVTPPSLPHCTRPPPPSSSCSFSPSAIRPPPPPQYFPVH